MYGSSSLVVTMSSWTDNGVPCHKASNIFGLLVVKDVEVLLWPAKSTDHNLTESTSKLTGS